MSTATPEKHTFQAEVKQLLDIVVHSLYTDRDIFIRELVSNASDALEKLRHLQLTEKSVFDDNLPLEINITTDDKAGTLTIQDFGIGMTHDELIENLGTIAHSGTRAFLQQLKEGNQNNENLIGQFGVGFYSAFMVAEEVQVHTHSWREDAQHLVWTSKGDGSFEIEEIDGQRRGCKIVLKLKEDCKEFSLEDKVKGILERYSSFVSFPVNLNGNKINTVEAIWLKSKSEISDEQYDEFYKFQAKAFDEPRYRLHFNADAPLTINSLLFVPQTNQEKLGIGKMEPGVALYCRNVMIDPDPEGLLPDWLRFLRGVVDSADLPLNISRESMQDSALVQKLNRVLTRRFLKMLEEEANKRPEQYTEFYDEFSVFLKEGVASDFTHKEQIAKLLRFESSLMEPGKTTSLADYVSRMKDDQKEIYYLVAGSRAAIENGPYLEAFKARGYEVLFLFEHYDEYVMGHIGMFDEKKLSSADQADLDLGDAPEQEGEALSEDEVKELSQWMRDTLGEKVDEIKSGKRLVDSPIVALNTDKMLSPAMRRLMKAVRKGDEGMDYPEPKMDLEINPRHSLIRNLNKLRTEDAERAQLICEQLYDNSLVAAGLIDEPREIISRVNKLLDMLAAK